MLKLQDRYLDWALKHIEKYGDTDIFPKAFEFDAIRHCWASDIKPWLKSENILKWKVRPYRRCLTPKHRYGFRISTQLDPIDAIIFSALICELGSDIEAVRLPKNEKVVFSHRFQISADGDMYDKDYNWDAFQNHSRQLIEGEKKYKYAVVADIADFYPRIYSHPLENALDQCTKKKNHVVALKEMLKRWNFSVSYGIPVGPSASRLLAELVIDDVDRGLLSEGAVHCRYVDDFRIFCETEREAHERLAQLANILFENHGLTLQQHKTKILGIKEFDKYFLQTEEHLELDSLTAKFQDILDKLGIENRYEELDYYDLDPATQERIDKLNLEEILAEQVSGVDIDVPLVRFILRRLGQLDNTDSVDLAIDNIDKLYTVFKNVILYIQALRSLNAYERQTIGSKLIDLLRTSLVGHLEYHRLWVFETFTKSRQWNNENTFVGLYNQYHDEFSQRKLVLSLGRAHQQSWFKSRKRSIAQFSPWLKRAFLASASCLPGDESLHWYRSIASSLDPLELAIVKWVKDNPF